MSHLFGLPNEFGDEPDPLYVSAPKNVDVDQGRYADLGSEDAQGRWESPEHYFARINRQEPDND